MNFKLELKKFGQKKNKIFKKEKIQINPDKYWIFVLLFNLIIIIGAFSFGYFMFEDANKEYVRTTAPVSKQGVKEKNLENVLKLFEERAKTSQQIKLNPSVIVDPTL